MVSDLTCILEDANVSSAICVGYVTYSSALPTNIQQQHRHDWGSQVCYEAARLRPDLFTAVAGVAIPVRTNILLRPLVSFMLPVSTYPPQDLSYQ